MTNQKNTPEKVAEVLEGSGLWKNAYGCSEMAEDRCTHLFAVGNCIGCNAYRVGLFRGRLTADQSEEILGKMGLCLIKFGGLFWLAKLVENKITGHIETEKVFFRCESLLLSAALNEGLAYCCENMFDELKLVMEAG